MGKKADADKASAAAAEKAMTEIEAAAKKQYARDLEAAAAAAGKWVWDESAKLFYNEPHAFYFDPERKFYYGGSPPVWTQTPPIPAGALFVTAPKEGGPPAASSSGRGAGAAAAAGTGGTGDKPAAGGGAPVTTKVVRQVVALPAHPQANTGGYQMHQVEGGRIGAAKGIGRQGAAAPPAGAKRAREEGAAAAGGQAKALSKEDQEALARREAARQRVQQRALNNFGMA